MEYNNAFFTAGMARKTEVLCFFMIAVAGFIACLLVFMNYLSLDMDTTHRFFDEEGRFGYNDYPWVNLLRRFIYFVLVGFYVAAVICCLHAWKILAPVWGFTWDKWLYLFSASMIGPVMLVNVTLKGNWGRARPRDIADFGGVDNHFTHFWVWADQCRDNCSFTSGEVSGVAMFVVSLALLLFMRKKIALLVVGGIICATTAWLRVAIGAHFLSDTIMAVVLMTMTACLIYWWFYLRENKWLKKLEAKSPANIS